MKMPSSKRARLMTLAVLFLVFVSGFLVGFALDRSLTAGPAGDEVEAQADRRDRDDDDDDRRDKRRRYVIDRVELGPEQRSRVDSIIAFHRQRTRELSEEFEDEYRPRYREIVSSTRESIKSVLTEEQAATYDSLLGERARHRSRHDDDSRQRENRNR